MENHVNGGIIRKWVNLLKKSKAKRVWYLINSVSCSKILWNYKQSKRKKITKYIKIKNGFNIKI